VPFRLRQTLSLQAADSLAPATLDCMCTYRDNVVEPRLIAAPGFGAAVPAANGAPAAAAADAATNGADGQADDDAPAEPFKSEV